MMQRGLQIMVLNILTCSLWTAVCQVIWLSGWFFCCFCCFFIIINIYTYAGCFLLHKTERGEICVDCANMSENVGRQRICLGRLWQEKKESWKNAKTDWTEQSRDWCTLSLKKVMLHDCKLCLWGKLSFTKSLLLGDHTSPPKKHLSPILTWNILLIRRFLTIAENAKGTVAVHCKGKGSQFSKDCGGQV